MSPPAARPIRTLVVDDEPLARVSLLALLARDQEIDVVGEAGDGRAAVESARALCPDLLLLDISMPEMDGFDVLAALGDAAPPETVFVTAHDHYAVHAFDVHAVDYVLKPVRWERLALALGRAKQRIRDGRGQTATWRDLDQSGSLDPPAPPAVSAGPTNRIAVRSAGRIRFVRTEAIDWIEAADYYSKLHVGERSFLIRQSMKSLEATLDPRRFVRIHRSSIVNVDRVREIRTRLHGGHTVVLRDDTTLQLSRSRRRALQTLLPD